RVPVRNGSKACPRMQVDACQPECGRYQGASLLAIGSKGFPILVHHSVEAPRPPAGERLLERDGMGAQRIRERLEIRRQRHNRADVEIAVCPSVETLTDAR